MVDSLSPTLFSCRRITDLYCVTSAETMPVEHHQTLIRDGSRRVLMDTEYNTLTDAVHALQTEVATLKSKIDNRPSVNVAFKAHLTASIPQLGANQMIEFNEVQFNNGHAYHGGTFIAPYEGTYLFSVYICSIGYNHWVALNILKNGVRIGQVMTGDASYTDCNSCTVVTELKKNDDVNVRHYMNMGGIQQDNLHLNTFTGVLLNVAN